VHHRCTMKRGRLEGNMQWNTVGLMGAVRASDGDSMDEDEDSGDKREDDSDDDSEDDEDDEEEEEDDDDGHEDPYVVITSSFVASTHLDGRDVSTEVEEKEEEEQEEEDGVWHELVDILRLKPANP
jgi:hypothetical protein